MPDHAPGDQEPHHPEDDALVERALAGDERAYAALFERYRQPLSHVVARIVHDPDDAADVVQETFIKAFRALGTYRREYRLSTWLYRIAANAAIDHVRRQRIQALSMDDPVDGEEGSIMRELAGNAPTPAQQMDEIEQKSAIDAAIASLPHKYRQVIELRHKAERSYEEIAAMLALPIGTVKIRIFRAREILRRKLRDLVT